MSIRHYLREIGRGARGARSITREQACDLWGQLLDGQVSDLEVGAFCLAMRIKGESPDEMAGFLDATEQRLDRPIPVGSGPAIVLPSYNGARKLAGLTPLLALLLAREGCQVLMHGCSTETTRVSAQAVLEQMGLATDGQLTPIGRGGLRYLPTERLCSGLKRMLDVRLTIGLRNSAHSVVKLLMPLSGPALLISSYTHHEYSDSMEQTLHRLGRRAVLLRGTEGEAVADARRQPRIDLVAEGVRRELIAAQSGPWREPEGLPSSPDALATARYVGRVLEGSFETPGPIAAQVSAVLAAAGGLEMTVAA